VISLEQHFRLPFVLPSFDDIEKAARARSRTYHNGYAELKATLQPAIVGYIRKAKLRPVLPGVLVCFHWRERDRRRDPLDIRAACKFVLDALAGADRPNDRQARAGILHCDGWHCVRGVLDDFSVAREGEPPGLVVTIVGTCADPRRAPAGWPFARVLPS